MDSQQTGAPVDREIAGRPALSSREEQILGLAASGLLDKEIGTELGISLNTLQTYWKRIRAKRGEGTRSSLVAEHVRSEAAKLRAATPTAPVDSEAVSVYLATELKRSRAFERKAARALQVFRTFFKESTVATTEQELMDAVCRVLVDVGGYVMAWVALPVHDEEKSISPGAWYPVRTPHLDVNRVSWGDNELGHGTTGRAFRTGQIQVSRDLLADPTMTPWLVASSEAGHQASISLPIVIGDSVAMALIAYASEPDAFDGQEVELLREVATAFTARIRMIREIPLAGGEPASWEMDLRDWTIRSFDLSLCRRLGAERGVKCDLDKAFTLFAPSDGCRFRNVAIAARESYVPSFSYRATLASHIGRTMGGSYVEVVRDEGGRGVLLRGRRLSLVDFTSAPFGDDAIGHYREDLQTGEAFLDSGGRSILRISEEELDLRSAVHSRIKPSIFSTLEELINEVPREVQTKFPFSVQIEDENGQSHWAPAEMRVLHDDSGPASIEVTLVAFG